MYKVVIEDLTRKLTSSGYIKIENNRITVDPFMNIGYFEEMMNSVTKLFQIYTSKPTTTKDLDAFSNQNYFPKPNNLNSITSTSSNSTLEQSSSYLPKISKTMSLPNNDRLNQIRPISLQSNSLAAKDFTSGLPNISNSCYINSVLQALRIVFKEHQIKLTSNGTYSYHIKKVLESLENNHGVYLSDYNSLILNLRTENWANGECRDAKEFFAFIINKLKSEGNPDIENLFTSHIRKVYSLECNHREEYKDSVMIMNYTSSSVASCIENRLNKKSRINEYPCKICKRLKSGNEDISTERMAKVNVIYTDPTTRPFHWSHFESQGYSPLCAIVISFGPVNHFKTISKKIVYDDTREYEAERFSYHGNAGRTDLSYLIFIKARP